MACLGRFLEDEDLHPPEYIPIRRNQYLTKPKHEPLSEGMCYCADHCGPHCVNRMLRIECVGDAGQDRGFTNCAVGPNCGNRRLQDGTHPRLVPVRTPGKGWGLHSEDRLSPGSLVIEYVGEILDEELMQQRTKEAAARRDNHVYMMEIDSNQIIDARFRGNQARFINHSCDPNCQLEKWNVGGATRIGIFAIKDIKPGEELSYDYQLWTRSRVRCCCGAANCRGLLGSEGGSKEEVCGFFGNTPRV